MQFTWPNVRYIWFPTIGLLVNVAQQIRDDVKFLSLMRRQIEDSKKPFVESPTAVAVIANRYDGIDLVDG